MGQRGRPKSLVENRNIRYTVRLTSEENKELIKIATSLGWSIADYLRSKALNNRKQFINGIALIANLDRVGGELGRAGNNINQLARHANILNKTDKLDESVMNRFNILFAEYIKMQQELETAMRKIIREAKG